MKADLRQSLNRFGVWMIALREWMIPRTPEGFFVCLSFLTLT